MHQYPSPYAENNTNYWNVSYSCTINDGNIHYWVFSIDTSIIYRGTTNENEKDESETREYKYVSDLNDYEGNFYSIKVFVDGQVLYDTYYSANHYDYLKNNQESWNLKYFTIGKCTYAEAGFWHYAKMNVYTMRLYNRGLTKDEIVANYNTTKAYYSIITGE